MLTTIDTERKRPPTIICALMQKWLYTRLRNHLREAVMNGINEDDLKRNVKDKDTWLRFVYLVVFGIAFYLSIILTFAVSIFQFLAKLFSGSAFAGLAEFGDNMATYQAQVTRFLTFASDEKPFPFAPFPSKTI